MSECVSVEEKEGVREEVGERMSRRGGERERD